MATYTVNDTITLNNPTRAGYTFTGWTYSGQTTPTKTVSLSNEVGNKTFTANWQANLNTIIFNANGGVGEMQPQKIYTDSRENLTTNSFVYSGYTFMGWATSASGSVVYYDGANYKMGTNSVYNLYAVWSKDTYNITYNLNNGTTSNPATYNVDTNTFTLNNPTRDGYEFIGWTGTGLNDYTNIVTIEKGSVGNRVYTANWQTTIVLHSNNGLNEQVLQRFVDTNTGNINANTFTNGDYIFNGWSTTVNGEVAYLDLASITLNQAYTDLYAVWGGTIGLTYLLNNDTYEVTGYNGTETDVLVADTYRGKTVASIGKQAFINKSGIERITIGTTISKIGSYAFDSVTARIIWNNPTIKEIGEYAFAGYDGTSIVVPSSVVKINSYAFYDSAITSLTIPETVTYIGNMAFAYCNDLMEVNYYAENCVAAEPKALSGEGIFYGSGNNVKLTIGENVKNIENVFSIYGYSQYKLDIESVYYLGTVEQWCQINFNREPLTKNLHIGGELVENIAISGAVTKINDYALCECTSLKSVVIESGVQEIGDYAFYVCANLESVDMADSIKTIGGHAFAQCKKLNNVNIPNGVEIIGAYAFLSCESLTSIVIPNSVTEIGNATFFGCKALENVVVGDGLEIISYQLFGYCENLTSVVIGAKVSEISSGVFEKCSQLTTIFTQNGLPSKIYNIDTDNVILKSATVYVFSAQAPNLNLDSTAYDGNYWHYVDGVPSIWVYTPEE